MVKFPDPIMVCGSGRDGTSAVAGLLHTAGVFMGFEMFTNFNHNPKGHFEDQDFLTLHMGKSLKVPGKCYNKLSGEHKDEFRELIRERRGLNWPWGFKDPRIAYYLKFYFEEFDCPKIIRLRRDMHDVRRSIMRTFGKTPEQIEESLGRETPTVRQSNAFYVRKRKLDKHLDGYPNLLEIQFEDLVRTRTEGCIDEILDFCQIPVSLKFKRREMSKFIIKRK